MKKSYLVRMALLLLIIMSLSGCLLPPMGGGHRGGGPGGGGPHGGEDRGENRGEHRGGGDRH